MVLENRINLDSRLQINVAQTNHHYVRGLAMDVPPSSTRPDLSDLQRLHR